MKKIMAIALIMVLALFLLTACGGGDTTDSGGGDSAPAVSQGGDENGGASDSQTGDESNASVPSGSSADLTTIEGFLSAFGLTEEDLKCANFTRLDITSYSLETYEIYDVGAYVSKELTDEEVRAWLDQIITKLGSLSDEGKIQNNLSDGDLTTDYIMSQTMYMGSGSYTYNGKGVTVMIAVTPGYLDNEDPDVAMAACTLSLEWD